MAAGSGNNVTMTVARAEEGAELQAFLATRLKLSRRRAKELIDSRRTWVNRQCVWMARHTLRAGDVVETRTAAAPPSRTLRILAEFPRYIVVDKPAGLLSVGAGSVEELLRARTGRPALRCVHRLDRETSGCLLAALDHEAFEAAVAVFRTRRVTKFYDVLAAGRMREAVTTIATPIDGMPARTHVRRVAANDVATLLRVRIETGRTHQIRLHLASIRHPVVGDRLHGLKTGHDPRLTRVPRQMLHAAGLEMDDPLGGGERLRAGSPLPADFRRCLQVFGLEGKRAPRPAARPLAPGGAAV